MRFTIHHIEHAAPRPTSIPSDLGESRRSHHRSTIPTPKPKRDSFINRRDSKFFDSPITDPPRTHRQSLQQATKPNPAFALRTPSPRRPLEQQQQHHHHHHHYNPNPSPNHNDDDDNDNDDDEDDKFSTTTSTKPPTNRHHHHHHHQPQPQPSTRKIFSALSAHPWISGGGSSGGNTTPRSSIRAPPPTTTRSTDETPAQARTRKRSSRDFFSTLAGYPWVSGAGRAACV